MFPTRILLATDGSTGTDEAVEAAIELATDTGSELHVMRSVSLEIERPYPALYAKERVGAMLEQRKLRALAVLDEQVGAVEKVGGNVAGSYYREGKMDRETIRLAEELEVGMIVTGGRKLGRFRKVLARIIPALGDSAERILHRAGLPVLVVRT